MEKEIAVGILKRAAFIFDNYCPDHYGLKCNGIDCIRSEEDCTMCWMKALKGDDSYETR